MFRNTPRTAFAAVAVSIALVTAACGFDSNPPSPAAVHTPVTQTSIAPTPAGPATPNPTPAVSPTQAVIGPGSWASTGSMVHRRSYGATATVLQDGRVLVAGGEVDGNSSSAAAELYDPATGRWTPTRKMFAKRRGHVATLLADGRVLVAGGWSYSGLPPEFGEIYDPSSGTWTKTSRMNHWRYSPSATLLADGRVLVTGGWSSGGGVTRHAEIYDPAANRWTATRNMAATPGPATSLADGRVLVMHEGRAPEIFDPGTGRWRTIASPLSGSPWDAAPVRLPDGEVLLLSPRNGAAELYDPAANAWTATSGPHTGLGPGVLLADGTVLVVGRVSTGRFDPITGSWSDVPRPPLPRDYGLDSIDGVEVNLIAVLRDGRILATENGSAAVYDPTAGG